MAKFVYSVCAATVYVYVLCVWMRFVLNEIVRLIATQIALYFILEYIGINKIWFKSMVSLLYVYVCYNASGIGQSHEFMWQIYMIAVWHVSASTSVEFDGYCFDRIHHQQQQQKKQQQRKTVIQTKIKTKEKSKINYVYKKKWNVLLCVVKANASVWVRRSEKETKKTKPQYVFVLFTFGSVFILMYPICNQICGICFKKTIDCISRAVI